MVNLDGLVCQAVRHTGLPGGKLLIEGRCLRPETRETVYVAQTVNLQTDQIVAVSMEMYATGAAFEAVHPSL